MSSLKTGWVIAAATAAAFAVGCAGQGNGHADMGASCAGEPAMPAKHGCKGMSECKAKVVKHHHHRHAKVEKQENVKDDNATTTTTTTKEETETKSESDSSK